MTDSLSRIMDRIGVDVSIHIDADADAAIIDANFPILGARRIKCKPGEIEEAYNHLVTVSIFTLEMMGVCVGRDNEMDHERLGGEEAK